MNSKTQSRNSMAKSHELPDIDKLEENRGTINQQIDRKSKMQSIAFCLSHLIDDYSFLSHLIDDYASVNIMKNEKKT